MQNHISFGRFQGWLSNTVPAHLLPVVSLLQCFSCRTHEQVRIHNIDLLYKIYCKHILCFYFKCLLIQHAKGDIVFGLLGGWEMFFFPASSDLSSLEFTFNSYFTFAGVFSCLILQWLLFFCRFNIIPILADILSESVKEKVTRIILATFRVSQFLLLFDPVL